MGDFDASALFASSATSQTSDTGSNPVVSQFTPADQSTSSFITPVSTPQGTTQPIGSDPANTYRVGSLGLTAVGGLTKAYAQYAAGEANASIDRYNASLDRIQEQQALEKGAEEANVQEEKGAILAGAQRGAQAGGGVVAGAGTGGAVIASSAATTQQNEFMDRLNAMRAAYGFEARASIDDTEADIAKRGGTQAAIGTFINTASQENLYADPNYRQRSSGFGSGT